MGTKQATIEMLYEIDTRRADHGDAMHPPEFHTTVTALDICIDGENVPEPLRGMLIEFMKEKIK